MGFPVLAFLFLLIGASWAVVPGGMGLWGYSQFPSASMQDEGNASLFGYSQKRDSFGQKGGLVYSPLDRIEFGASVLKEGQYTTGYFSGKFQFPRFDSWQPLLSVGFMDLAMDRRRWENLYFVGGYDFHGESIRLFLDLGAIYHRHGTEGNGDVTAFLGTEMQAGIVSFMLEASRGVEGSTVIPSFWLRPFGPWLYGGVGTEWSGGLKTEPWGEIGIDLPLGARPEFSKNPWILIDLNPLFDHAYSPSLRQYQLFMDAQSSFRTGVRGLYWVNGGTFPVIHSSDQNLLMQHGIWDRSYILFRDESAWGGNFKLYHPELGAGMFFDHSLGVAWWQKFGHRIWNPAEIYVGAYRGNVSGVAASMRLPLHPRGPSFLRWVQFYAEGGKFLQEGLKGFGGMHIGSDHNYLDGSIGLALEEKQLLARVDLRMDLSHWTTTQAGPVRIRALNRIEHHMDAVLQDFDAEEFETEISGNHISNPSQIPWNAPEWVQETKPILKRKPKIVDADSDGYADQGDSCPASPEDRDGYMDSDGCPDLDNDADRISDLNDPCPFDKEDEDLFEDGDGCPDEDNDKDGIADNMDSCPNEAEDLDGFQDTDGCRDPDNDHDGVRDSLDACPNDAGPFTNQALSRGCPEGDDNDGIPFDLDACPNAAEDFDGIQDMDGCPE